MRAQPETATIPQRMAFIPGGNFLMGSDRFYPEEKPVRRVTVSGFFMDTHEVNNEDFQKFTAETGYVTVAERPLDPENYPGVSFDMLVPGSLVFKRPSTRVDTNDFHNWWQWVRGACWKHPAGPASSIKNILKHPVVHVAYEDAEQYARWAGKELPTEPEWEYAARGGLEGKNFSWGDEDVQYTHPMANTWQGTFPYTNLMIDGFEGTSPVGFFPPNGFGLYDMAGNVWEWTSDWYLARQDSEKAHSCCGTAEASFDPCQPEIRIPRKVIKGGSYLCSPDYCLRYRPSARQPQMIDTGMSHIGFRCIKRVWS